MVVPASPVIPRNEDRRVIPIAAVFVAFFALADRIHDRGNPRRPPWSRTFRMVRIAAIGNYPADRTKAAAIYVV